MLTFSVKSPGKRSPSKVFRYCPPCHNCFHIAIIFNPLKVELNPICHLLALLGAHHILHVNRIRLKFLLAKILFRHSRHVWAG